MKNKRRKRKNCPECRYWWFNRITHGCNKNPERLTYTSITLPDVGEREFCPDMMKRKKKK
ncbi:MAG: hypothetical protein ACTSX1_04480 [Candidatus Heimdallarchaeaceae archaeon]